MSETESKTPLQVVFVGDSLTASGEWDQWFPDLQVVNLGVAGATSDDVLASLDDIVACEPDEIVLMIGTNDLGRRRTVEHLVRNIEVLLVGLRRALPGSRLLLQSILPRGAEFSADIVDANIHLRQFCATVSGHYLDLWPTFSTEKGRLDPKLSDDALHLNAEGYEAWLHELRPALERLHELPPMTTPIHIVTTDARRPRRR